MNTQGKIYETRTPIGIILLLALCLSLTKRGKDRSLLRLSGQPAILFSPKNAGGRECAISFIIYNLVCEIYKILMYDQIKQQALRLGTEIDRQAQLCREWQNAPRRFEVYRKTQPKMDDSINLKDMEQDKKQNEEKCKRCRDEISKNLMERINELIHTRRDDRAKAIKEQLQKVKQENLELRDHVEVLVREVANKEDEIERMKNEYNDYMEREEISKAIIENSEEEMGKKMQSLEEARKIQEQKIAELTGKIERYEEINKKLGEELKVRREEGNEVNKFNQKLQEELERKVKEIQKLNIMIEETEEQKKDIEERQAKKNNNLNNAIATLKGEIQRLIQENANKGIAIKELQEVIYHLNYEKEERIKMEQAKIGEQKEKERISKEEIDSLKATIDRLRKESEDKEKQGQSLLKVQQQEVRRLLQSIEANEAKYDKMLKDNMQRQQELIKQIEQMNTLIKERQTKDEENVLNRNVGETQTQQAQSQQNESQTSPPQQVKENQAQTEPCPQSSQTNAQTDQHPHEDNESQTEPAKTIWSQSQTEEVAQQQDDAQTELPILQALPLLEISIPPEAKEPPVFTITNPFYLSISPQQPVLSISHQFQFTIQEKIEPPQCYIPPQPQSFNYLPLSSLISSNPSLMLPYQLSSYRLKTASNLNSRPNNASTVDLQSLNRARIQTESQVNDMNYISSIKVLQQEPSLPLPHFTKKHESQASHNELQQLIKHYSIIQEQSIAKHSSLLTLKNSYLRIQTQQLLLLSECALKQEQIALLLRKNAEQQSQLVSLRGDFLTYSNLIGELNKRIEQLQKYSCSSPKTGESQDRLANLHNIINLINHNCLKNNCDSTGIINIQLNKFPEKDLDYINLSPTDLEKFNKKEDAVEQKEEAREYEGHLLCHYKSQESLGVEEKEKTGSKLNINEIERKKSVQSQNYLNKHLANRLVKLSHELQNERDCHTESPQFPLPPKVPPSPNSKQLQKHSLAEQRSISIENNPDNEITLTYQQLKQKYRNLYLQNEKMAEYLRALHIINLKWKKSTAELEHHSKVNVLGKLADRVANLLHHREKSPSLDNHDFLFAELTSLIKDIQNYIHFLDHLIKIEPFQDHYRSPYHFKRLGKKAVLDLKLEKEVVAKKTYSEGCSREDDFVENFDIYPYETDEIPHSEERKESEKKEFEQFDKFYPEENKELFSEISSVKNQSQWSQISSFIHSKTELQPLGHYLKNNKNIKNIDEIDEQYALKRDYPNPQPKSFNELRHLYIKIREENEELLKERGNYERLYKREIERLENEHNKKMNKITKEFNDSFGLLCQRSGLHHREKEKGKRNHKETQVEMPDPQIRKKSHSRTEFENPAKMQQFFEMASQEMQEKVREKEERNREQALQLDRNKAVIADLSKKLAEKQECIDRLNRCIALSSKKDERMLSKLNQDLSQFLTKIISKTPADKPPVLERAKSFRKNSTSIHPSEYLTATKISELAVTPEQMFLLLREELKGKEEWSDKLPMDQLKGMVVRWIAAFRRDIYKGFLEKIREKLEGLLGVQLQDWCQQFQEYRLSLEDYFNQDPLVSQIFSHLNELILKLRGGGDNNESCGSLSINSRVVEEEFSKYPSEEDNRIIKIESRPSQQDLRRQLQEHKVGSDTLKSQLEHLSSLLLSKEQTITQLRGQLKQRTQQLLLSSYSPLQVVLREKQKEIISMQQQILALREQATKLKHKSKRPKVYHIQN